MLLKLLPTRHTGTVKPGAHTSDEFAARLYLCTDRETRVMSLDVCLLASTLPLVSLVI